MTTGLVHVDFNLTNDCNLSCSHCHSSSGSALPDELTTDEILDVVHKLHSLGALSVAFAGGEPFMRRDIKVILKEAAKLPGWRVSAVTNGLFLTDEMISWIATECPEVGLNVSIDGSTPETFGELRAQPGASTAAQAALFRRVVNGAKNAAGAGLHVSINTTITKSTSADLIATYELAISEIGAKAMVAIKFFPAGYGRYHLDRYDFSWPQWSGFFAGLTRAKLNGEIPLMQLSVPSAWEFYLPLIHAQIDLDAAEQAWRYRSPLRELSYARQRQIGDVAGWAELCISGDGRVYPSVLMVGDENELCGSTRDTPLEQIWDSAPRLLELRGLGLPDVQATCHSCELADLCGGGSRSRALAEHGHIRAGDTACPIVAQRQLTLVAR